MKTKRLYEFGRFRLDPEDAVLYSDGKPVYLKPKVFETLLALVEHHGRVLDKETLMQRLWHDTFVEEANLTVNISQLRKALGQSAGGEALIETLPRRGYRFNAEVREIWTEEAALVVKEITSAHITIEEQDESGEEGLEVAAQIHQPAVTVLSATPQSVAPDTRLAPATNRLRLRKRVAWAMIALLTLVGVIGAVYLLFFRSVDRFQKLQVSRLPSTRGIFFAAISPDGKFLAYVATEAGRDSLKLRQLATTTDTELLPPAALKYRFLQFSLDGNYIYYSGYSPKSAPESSQPAKEEVRLYKIPTLGGNPIPILAGIHERFAVSPDGRKLAIIRDSGEGSELLIANEDGSRETALLKRAPDVHFDNPAWSRDGKSIAFVSRQGHRRTNYQLVSVGVEDQTKIQISSQQWPNVLGLVWCADGKGLLMTASAPGASQQLWHIAYPDGAARMISADTNQYISILSLTADDKAMVSTVSNLSQTLWIVGDEGSATAREIKGRSNCTNPTWTAAGQILFTSRASGNQDIWMTQADGTNQKQLTVSEASDRIPVVSPDGSYLVFVSTRSGTENIWRMNLDGSNPVQLTKGKSDTMPSFSPDGKWLVYTSIDSEPTLWKMPTDGGDPVQLTQTYSASPAVSPDGKLIACLWKRDKSDSFLHIALLPVTGGAPVKLFAAKANGYVRWADNGRAVLYATTENDVTNIWMQPLDGSPPTQMTKFTEGAISSFDLSPDGKRIVCSRQLSDNFLALIKTSD